MIFGGGLDLLNFSCFQAVAVKKMLSDTGFIFFAVFPCFPPFSPSFQGLAHGLYSSLMDGLR